jgi:hypothetical protein
MSSVKGKQALPNILVFHTKNNPYGPKCLQQKVFLQNNYLAEISLIFCFDSVWQTLFPVTDATRKSFICMVSPRGNRLPLC